MIEQSCAKCDCKEFKIYVDEEEISNYGGKVLTIRCANCNALVYKTIATIKQTK